MYMLSLAGGLLCYNYDDIHLRNNNKKDNLVIKLWIVN